MTLRLSTRSLLLGFCFLSILRPTMAGAEESLVDGRPTLTALDRLAIGRVAFAEAGNQGDGGLAAVVEVIINRLASGAWGSSVNDVLNAKNQFEPVTNAGGDWRRLPPTRPTQQARIDVIVNLTLAGLLPDITHGARYFQNPSAVAARVRAGKVRSDLLNFGGATPSAVVGSHAFFVNVRLSRPLKSRSLRNDTGAIFFPGMTDVTEPSATQSRITSSATGAEGRPVGATGP
jgi:hypothetical protein